MVGKDHYTQPKTGFGSGYRNYFAMLWNPVPRHPWELLKIINLSPIGQWLI